MKLSARNVLSGKILSVKRGPVTSLVVIEVAPGVRLSSSITTRAANELKLVRGRTACAIIKSSSVILGVD